MMDREKVLTVLGKRFPGASAEQMAAAANAIVGMDDEWEELTGHDICDLAQRAGEGAKLRLFQHRQGGDGKG